MSEGERFVEKCLQTEVQLQPWPYQVIDDTLSENAFTKLQEGCDKNLKLQYNRTTSYISRSIQRLGHRFLRRDRRHMH